MRCVPIEAGDTVQCRRPSLKKPLMTGSALGAVAQPFARQTVDRIAVRADDMQRGAHVYSARGWMPQDHAATERPH
jgi:hypothetical protein